MGVYSKVKSNFTIELAGLLLYPLVVGCEGALCKKNTDVKIRLKMKKYYLPAFLSVQRGEKYL